MPVIGSVDPAAKRIYLATGVRSYHPVDDLYRELRALRRTDEALRPFDMPLIASGNVPKGGGKFTPRLVTFRDGWKVVPEDVSHTLNVTGEQITDDGQSGPAALDFAPLAATSKVVVQYEPPAAEIIEREIGSGVTNQDKLDIADEVRNELSVELGEILNAKFILQRKRVLDPATGIFTIYDDDGVTPLFTAQTYKDAAGTQPFDGEGRILRTEALM